MKLVKAMACFMAATMAITCVPSANVVNGVSLVAEAAETDVITKSTNVPETIANANFWGSFSPYYQMTGDFSIQLDFQCEDILPSDNYKTPLFVFTNDVNRNDDAAGYTEYRVIRSDAYAWNGATNSSETPGFCTFETSWENDWDAFKAGMKNAKIISTITREGNNFSLENNIQGGDGNNYTYKVTFTENNAADTIRFFMTSEGMGVTINSFKHTKDNCLVTPFPETVKYDDTKDCYMVPVSDKTIVTENPDNEEFPYIVDESKIFTGAASDTPAKIGDVVTVTASYKDKTYDFKYQLFENKCDKISIIDDVANRKIGFGDSYDATVKVTGEDATGIVSDSIQDSIVNGNAKVDLKSSDVANNEYVYTITPTKSGTGEVKFVCGDQEVTSSYNAVDNVCISLASEQGETITTRPNQRTTITMVALATDSSLLLSNEIEIVSSSGIDDDEQITSASAIKSEGKSIKNFYVVASTGEGLIRFRCGDVTRDIKIVGRNASTDTTTPTTPTEPTTPTDPTTPAEPATPGGVDTDPTTPEEPSTPSEPTTPTEPATPEEPTTPEEPSTTTTKKKVAKLSSVKATKGKKAVSGKVTIKATGKNVKKATIKVYVNGKKNVTTTTKATGKFSVKVSKKLKKGDKVKVVATKTTIKKVTKTVTVK